MYKVVTVVDESLKRIIDLLLTIFILILLSPIFLIVAILEKLSSEDVFFKQERIGKNLTPIYVYKFTTMPKGSEKKGSITTISDKRISRLGRFLRRYKINELPQIINVVKGDMSLVGPRPLLQEHANIYEEEARRKIYSVRPGLTGIGSIYFSKEDILMDKFKSKEEKEHFYKTKIMPEKARMELWYIQNRNIILDLYILLLTGLKLLGLNISGVSLKNIFPCFEKNSGE